MLQKTDQPSCKQEKTEQTIIWETKVKTASKSNVISFPTTKEATHQEKTIQQDETVVKIRMVSSGFGNLQSCMRAAA